ncbi:hypothetical protein BV898_10617 [Hypsibius exemplaris]|uniref:Uncharacterized protein n=1 Tax=Hypsibius exemplaris TaxID=2072580 RepID=A0A1W0WJ49_HYPEX|nr:hypothetical protein BV898_10617 [Hypsibius exemplaris]
MSHTFSLQLEEDLAELSQAFVAYKIMSKICENYIPYVKNQTRPPLAVGALLLRAVQKMVAYRPAIAQEVQMKKNIGRKVNERLLQVGSAAGDEYDQGAAFLRRTRQDLLGLSEMSNGMSELLSLAKKQSRKVTDIGNRFISPLLRKQTSLDMNINMGSGRVGSHLTSKSS